MQALMVYKVNIEQSMDSFHALLDLPKVILVFELTK